MIGLLQYASLALIAVSSVSGLVVPRKTAPKGYNKKSLESYDAYHLRYLAVGCKSQHGKPFFESCCRPLKKGAKPSKKCTPTAAQVKKAKAEVAKEDKDAKTPKNDDDDDEDSGSSGGNSGGSFITGGSATFYNQGGVAGACGKRHSDSDLVVAMQIGRYGNQNKVSPLCGKRVEIINTKNGKSVTALIADACPSCQNNRNSIDLSRAAFRKIAKDVEGLVPIKWRFV